MKTKIFFSILLLIILTAFFPASLFFTSWPPAPKFYPLLTASFQELPGEENDSDDYRKLQAFWKVYVPDWFGQLVAMHIEKMYQAGNFKELCEQDFDHGHLLLYPSGKKSYVSVDDLLKDVIMVLYHTDELDGRWKKDEKNNVPVEKRNPRSIIGRLNGEILSAKNVIPPEKFSFHQYENSGTIYHFEIAETYNLCAIGSAMKVSFKGKLYAPELQFAVKPRSWGRYVVGAQKRYDIFIRLNKEQ